MMKRIECAVELAEVDSPRLIKIMREMDSKDIFKMYYNSRDNKTYEDIRIMREFFKRNFPDRYDDIIGNGFRNDSFNINLCHFIEYLEIVIYGRVHYTKLHELELWESIIELVSSVHLSEIDPLLMKRLKTISYGYKEPWDMLPIQIKEELEKIEAPDRFRR